MKKKLLTLIFSLISTLSYNILSPSPDKLIKFKIKTVLESVIKDFSQNKRDYTKLIKQIIKSIKAADFEDFAGMDFSNQDLSNTDLRNKNFTSARFYNCRLEGSMVYGANFQNVRNLSNEQIEYLNKNGAINVPKLPNIWSLDWVKCGRLNSQIYSEPQNSCN